MARLDPAALPSAIVGSTDDAVFAMAEGVILSWNHGAEKLFGYTAREAIGRPVWMLAQEGRQAEVAKVVERLKAGEHIEAIERTARRKDGSSVEISATLSPIFDDSGRVAGAACVAIDVTERKRSEAKIRSLNAELKRRVSELTALTEELESFSYSVSHDLRAPLGRILGFAELLQKTTLDEHGRHYAEVIARSASQMADLIRDLLEFSRMSRAETAFAEVDLEQLARDCIADFEMEAAGRKVAWTVHELPVVRGDPAMLRIVLQNLLSNALKFTRTRPITVIEVGCARGCRGDARAKECVIYVRDNGVGFDMARASRLFSPFARLHPASSFPGTGVGLATVRRILTRHHGEIWAQSKPDQGATFYVSLPKARAA